MDAFSSLRRHMWSALFVVSIGMAMTLALTAAWPSFFRSTVTVAVEDYIDAAELNGSSAADVAAARLAQVQRLPDNVLTDIGAAYRKHVEARDNAVPVAAPADLRRQLRVALLDAAAIGAEHPEWRKLTARYLVSYRHAEAEDAQFLADAFGAAYREAFGRMLAARDARRRTESLEHEQRVRAKLDTLSTQLAELDGPTGALGSPANATQIETEQRLAAARGNLNAMLASIADMEARRAELQRQLENLPPVLVTTREEKVNIDLGARKKQLTAEVEAATARLGPDHADVGKLKAALANVDERLRQRDAHRDRRADLDKLRAKLAQMRKTRPADDPDLLMMSELEKRFEQEIGGGATLTETRMVEVKRPNPEHQALQTGLRRLDEQHQTAAANVTTLRASVASLEQELTRVSAASQQQQALTQQHQQLQERRAVVATQLKAMEEAGDIPAGAVQIVSAAQLAAYSEKSRSYLVLIVGALLSGAAGFLFVWRRERTDTTVRSAKTLHQLTGGGIPVAVMPYVYTGSEVGRARMRMMMNFIAAAAGWTLVIVGIVYARQPLNDILAQWF